MNNFELDEQAKILSDTLTNYALARRVIELEERVREYDGYKDKLMGEYEELQEALSWMEFDESELLRMFRDGVYE